MQGNGMGLGSPAPNMRGECRSWRFEPFIRLCLPRAAALPMRSYRFACPSSSVTFAELLYLACRASRAETMPQLLCNVLTLHPPLPCRS